MSKNSCEHWIKVSKPRELDGPSFHSIQESRIHHIPETGSIKLTRQAKDPIVLGEIFLHLIEETLGDVGYVHVTNSPQLNAGDIIEIAGGRSEPVLRNTKGKVLATVFLPQDGL